MSENTKLKVAFLWHMHQPFYLHPDNNSFMMPWVRFHGLKDYLDMPLLAAQYPSMKMTFNLVPSLLDQIEMYGQGYTDRHLELSRKSGRSLTLDEKKEMLLSFFSAPPATMIEPYPRYRQLYRKKDSCGADINLAAEIFSSTEWRDLQVWSNLVWIDPMFRRESPVRELFEKGRDFSDEDKEALLEYQLTLLKRIVPTYKRLYKEGKIDISFTPYYHPILPLLVDQESAKEAMPALTLPKNHFRYPEDALWHLQESRRRFREIFESEAEGIWPSEGSVSEDVLRLVGSAGFHWAATDEDILYQSLAKSGLEPRHFSPHTVYAFENVPDLKLFFRDHGLSDKIGFVYSNWNAEKAAADFMMHLSKIREVLSENLNSSVIPIILDGENAWEYYPNDGHDFLERLFDALSRDDRFQVVSFSDAAAEIKPTLLPRIFAGSWINHNFKIWIGHYEDNTAWDLVYDARKTLIEFQARQPQFSKEKLAAAWKQLYIAEGSDWYWWFGDEHIGAHNSDFDRLFRLHLSAVYKIIGSAPPTALAQPIHRARTESFISLPEALVTPQIDGALTHYYEWSGAGHYDCSRAGGAMHRGDRLLSDIYFAYDHEQFYIRLDFTSKIELVDSRQGRILIDFRNAGVKEMPLIKTAFKDEGEFRFSFKNLLEAAFTRTALLKEGHGKIEFYVSFHLGNQLIERWPLDDPIVVNIPEREREIFWQV